MRLTPWFPATVQPRRVGFYDTRVAVASWIRARNGVGGVVLKPVDTIEVRLYWNGRVWLASRQSHSYTAGLFRQHREWRGVFSHAKT